MSDFVAAKNVPLRLGQPDEFSRVREFFHSVSFDEMNVLRVLSLDSMSEVGAVNWEKISLKNAPAPLIWCIKVFIRGLRSDGHEALAWCGDDAFASFLSLGLLRPAKNQPEMIVSPVWLYPCDGFLVASDRTSDPDGGPYQPNDDVVFPAIYPGTLRFLKLLPDGRNGDSLDLCGGSGIGALHQSRTARSATTSDVAERSAFFADFNGRLNGTPVISVCGDVFQPVNGRQFDVISAHPPFVPAVGPNMVYRDGGDTGEEVTRQIIAGLPAQLRAGGTCVILCVGRDTNEKTFEQRAQDWLGQSHHEFDIIFGCEKILSVGEVVESLRRGGTNPGEFNAQTITDRLLSLNTRQFVYGALFLRRLTASNGGEPLRLQLTTQGDASDFQRVFRWREETRQPDFTQRFAASRPRMANHLELTVRHVMKDGDLVPAEFTFNNEDGFRAVFRLDGWIVPLIARLNGTRSVHKVFEAARSADDLAPGFTLEAFLGLVRQLIEHGFLIDDLGPPP